jgi:hypothetical protein
MQQNAPTGIWHFTNFPGENPLTTAKRAGKGMERLWQKQDYRKGAYDGEQKGEGSGMVEREVWRGSTKWVVDVLGGRGDLLPRPRGGGDRRPWGKLFIIVCC